VANNGSIQQVSYSTALLSIIYFIGSQAYLKYMRAEKLLPMKQLTLNSPHYRYIVQGFREWLDILGYSEQAVYQLPNYIQEFLHHAEKQGCNQLQQIQTSMMQEHYNNLKQRNNLRQGGGLSNSYLNKHQQALKKFCDYLRQTGRMQLSKLNLKGEDADHEITSILTQEEIKQLYQTTYTIQEPKKRSGRDENFYEALSMRDRAILAVFYGCGCRRNEGVYLDITDINFDKEILFVRKGKNYKERFVPINSINLKHLADYVYDARQLIMKGARTDALFVSEKGKRADGQTLQLRLKRLILATDNILLQQKEITLHSLRHSIATHLLQNGMSLENIARFLGHTSLESTQIYTHLVKKEEHGEV
jgi:integrase/recombinase XerD